MLLIKTFFFLIQIDINILRLCIGIQDHFMRFAADPGIFVTAKWSSGFKRIVGVDPYASSLDRFGNAEYPIDISGPNAARQAVFIIICQLDHFFFIFKFDDRSYWAEDLFLRYSCIVCCFQQCRF